jgi:hypothetical protein
MLTSRLGPRARHLIGRLLASVGLATLLVVQAVSSPPAEAQTGSCVSPHCYSVGLWPGGNGPFGLGVFAGAGAVLRIPASSVTSPSSNFLVVADLWYLSSPNVNPGGFIEVGAIRGMLCCGGGTPTSAVRWFWGDLRPGSSYFAHFINYASPGDSAYVQIDNTAPNTFTITGGGFVVGTSYIMPCCGSRLDVGSETYNAGGGGGVGSLSATHADNLTFKSLGGTWAAWNASYAGYITQNVNNPPYGVGAWFPAGNWIYGY